MPLEVIEEAQANLSDWQGLGMSVMEISHRGKAFGATAEQAESDLRELLNISADYAVLFLQGGATQQFALIPMNFAGSDRSADYLLTGSWSKKAHAEAVTEDTQETLLLYLFSVLVLNLGYAR